MKKIIFAIAALVFLALLDCGSASARPSPYVLDVAKIKNSDFEKVQLRNKASGRILWTRTVTDRRDSHWSPDHRAVAVETTNFILVWRAGHRLFTVKFPGGHKLGSDESYDYSMGYAWSPDKQHLLIRFGGSGSTTWNTGTLYCLKLNNNRYNYSRVQPLVWKMQWRDNRTVWYWPYNFETQEWIKKPRLWRIP